MARTKQTARSSSISSGSAQSGSAPSGSDPSGSDPSGRNMRKNNPFLKTKVVKQSGNQAGKQNAAIKEAVEVSKKACAFSVVKLCSVMVTTHTQ